MGYQNQSIRIGIDAFFVFIMLFMPFALAPSRTVSVPQDMTHTFSLSGTEKITVNDKEVIIKKLGTNVISIRVGGIEDNIQVPGEKTINGLKIKIGSFDLSSTHVTLRFPPDAKISGLPVTEPPKDGGASTTQPNVYTLKEGEENKDVHSKTVTVRTIGQTRVHVYVGEALHSILKGEAKTADGLYLKLEEITISDSGRSVRFLIMKGDAQTQPPVQQPPASSGCSAPTNDEYRFSYKVPCKAHSKLVTVTYIAEDRVEVMIGSKKEVVYKDNPLVIEGLKITITRIIDFDNVNSRRAILVITPEASGGSTKPPETPNPPTTKPDEHSILKGESAAVAGGKTVKVIDIYTSNVAIWIGEQGRPVSSGIIPIGSAVRMGGIEITVLSAASDTATIKAVKVEQPQPSPLAKSEYEIKQGEAIGLSSGRMIRVISINTADSEVTFKLRVEGIKTVTKGKPVTAEGLTITLPDNGLDRAGYVKLKIEPAGA